MTDTVAMVAVGIGSTAKAGAAVDGDSRTLLIHTGCAALGGLGGAALLLTTSADVFAAVVPFPLAMASASLPRRLSRARLTGPTARPRLTRRGRAPL